MGVEWGTSFKYSDGNAPRLCVNNRGWVLEVHKSEWWHKVFFFFFSF